jgi:hypothetical protein
LSSREEIEEIEQQAPPVVESFGTTDTGEQK